MKKSIIICLLVIGFTQAHAQKFALGVKAGITSSTLLSSGFSGFKDLKSTSNYNGALLGVYSQVGILGFYLQPEAYLRNYNFTVNYDSLNTSLSSLSNKLYYIDVPVLFGKSFFKIFSVKAGPSFQFLLNNDGSVINPANNQTVHLDKGSFNQLVVGFQAGASIDISRISVDIRYDFGLNKIGNVAKSYSSNLQNVDFSSRASILMFTVGYKFIKL